MNQIVEFEWRTETDEMIGGWRRDSAENGILPLTVADVTPVFSTSLKRGNWYHLDIKLKLFSNDFVTQVLQVPDTVEQDNEEEDGKKEKSIHGKNGMF